MAESIQLTSIEGNSQRLDGGAMFGNVPRALWERWTSVDDQGRIPLACRALLVEINSTKILCETGIGCFFEPKLSERFGVQDPDHHKLLENLKNHDIQEEDIDYVILSHLHFDHAGGMLPSYKERQETGERLLFPNAKYVIGQEAWERAMNPHPRDRASFIPELMELLKQNTDRVILIENNHIPGVFEDHIKFVYSQGHTPGQMHTLITGNNGKLFFAGDLIPGRSWVHLPITMGYDRFPEKLIDEKKELYNQVLEEDWTVYFTHDPEVCAAHLGKNEKGRFTTTSETTHFSHQAL